MALKKFNWAIFLSVQTFAFKRGIFDFSKEKKPSSVDVDISADTETDAGADADADDCDFNQMRAKRMFYVHQIFFSKALTDKEEEFVSRTCAQCYKPVFLLEFPTVVTSDKKNEKATKSNIAAYECSFSL